MISQLRMHKLGRYLWRWILLIAFALREGKKHYYRPGTGRRQVVITNHSLTHFGSWVLMPLAAVRAPDAYLKTRIQITLSRRHQADRANRHGFGTLLLFFFLHFSHFYTCCLMFPRSHKTTNKIALIRTRRQKHISHLLDDGGFIADHLV